MHVPAALCSQQPPGFIGFFSRRAPLPASFPGRGLELLVIVQYGTLGNTDNNTLVNHVDLNSFSMSNSEQGTQPGLVDSHLFSMFSCRGF